MAYALRYLTGTLGGTDLMDNVIGAGMGVIDAVTIMKTKYGGVIVLLKSLLIIALTLFMKVPLPKGVVISAWYMLGFIVGSLLG